MQRFLADHFVLFAFFSFSQPLDVLGFLKIFTFFHFVQKNRIFTKASAIIGQEENHKQTTSIYFLRQEENHKQATFGL